MIAARVDGARGAVPGLRMEILDGVAPLDAQMGVWPKRRLPAGLKEALFPGGGVATYALVDAAKAPLLPELLDEAGLEHRCLYSGEEAAPLRAVAPYLVALTPESDFTRALFTRAGMPGDLYDKRPALFLQSRADFMALWRHLHRFTRVRDADGGWYYFRFWESALVEALPDDPEGTDLVARLFFPICTSAAMISQEPDTVTFLRPEGLAEEAPDALPPWPRMAAALGRAMARVAIVALAAEISGEGIGSPGHDKAADEVRRRWRWLEGWGLREIGALKTATRAILASGIGRPEERPALIEVLGRRGMSDETKAQLVEQVCAA